MGQKGKNTMNTHHREKYQTMQSFRAEFGVGFTLAHTGKMTGFQSLSTSPLHNTFCQARAKCKNTICSHCYSIAMQKQYENLSKMLERNLEVLTTELIPVEKWPIVNALMIRLESFGDVMNGTQIKNYFNFCRRNPRVQFTVWTKNLPLYREVLKTEGKPENLIIIASSPVVNLALDPFKAYPFVDKVFTVYTKEFAALHGIKINCGARSCAACQLCYSKNDVRFVNELLK